MEKTEKQHVCILAKLMEFQQRQVLCDIEVTLKEGHVVRASSVTMAAMSPVFEAMLTTDMTETRTKCVRLEHVSSEAWNCAVHFFYGSEKLVTVDNVEEMLSVGEAYQMDNLTMYCDDHLIDFCTPDNALVMRKLAKRFNLSTALTDIDGFVTQEFAAVTKSADFMELEKEELFKLLELQGMAITEDDLCRSLFSWSEHKNLDETTLGEVLSKLHPWQLTTGFLLDHVLYHGLTAAVQSFRTAVVQEIKTRCSGHLLSESLQGLQPRSCSETSPLDLVVLGHDEESMHCLVFSPLTQSWREVPCPPRESGAAAVLVDDRIYVMGGDNETDRKLRHVFDVRENVWISEPSFDEPLNIRALVRMGGTVYGLSDSGYIKFDPKLQLHTLKQGRFSCADYDDSVVVMDRIIALSKSNVVEIVVGKGTSISKSLPTSMTGVRGTTYGDVGFFLSSEGHLLQIRRVGGQTEVAGHVSLQEFEERESFGLYVWNQCLWIFGGYDFQDEHLNTVDCYNLQGEKLSNAIIPPMPVGMKVWAVINAKISKE